MNPFAALLRSLFGGRRQDRRKYPRARPARGESLLVGVRPLAAAESEALLFANVRDITERGLSAALRANARQVVALGEAPALSLIIRLPPDHTLTARGSLVYTRPVEEGREYLIGASFDVLSSADRERLRAYLAALGGEN